MPKICVDPVLASQDLTEPGVESTQEPIGECRTLRYLSIVAAAPSGAKNADFGHDHLGYPLPQRKYASSLSLYKLEVTGSAAQAREQAILHAFAYGWSTLFTVVVHDKGMVAHAVKDLGPESIRVRSLAALISEEKEEYRRKVFF